MKFKQVISAVIASISLLSVSLSAYEAVEVRLNGEDTKMGALLIGSTTYVPFESANTVLSEGKARISGSSSEMRAETPEFTVTAREGDSYLAVHGRYLGAGNAITISGMLYVPIRAVSKAYSADVHWNADTRSVDLYSTGKPLAHGDSFYDADDVYWLSRIIHAEASGEPFEGKIMVGNVVMNRVASRDFPDTIRGVIFDDKYGVQFTPTANGTIHNEPCEDSIIAAKLTLDGYFLSRNALYFLNPRIAANFWVPANRPFLTSVGNHDFYS